MSLTHLYITNECTCSSKSCKQDLNNYFKELTKTDPSETVIRNLTCLMKGSQKSIHHAKIFCFLLGAISHCEQLSKEMLEAYLELFTVVYLKSDHFVQEILMLDLLDVLETLERNQIKIFVEAQFGYKIALYRTYQLKHCLRKDSRCSIKDRTSMLNKAAVTCEVHSDFEPSISVIDITAPNRFCPFVSFLLTFLLKIFNLKNAGEQGQVSQTIFRFLFNFISNCKNEFLYYPMRALSEFFQRDQTAQILSKCLNSKGLTEFKMDRYVFSDQQLLQDFTSWELSNNLKSSRDPKGGPQNQISKETVKNLLD
jgi:hypothetical protein